MTSGRPSLTLYIPGLLGPWSGPGELVPPRVPALRRWLARADRLAVSRAAPEWSFEADLARLFGLPGETPPWGAYGLWGEIGQRPEGFMLRLDPVHLRLGMTEAIVSAGAGLRPTADEARALARTLEQHFHDSGWRIDIAAPDRWYLHLPEVMELHAAPLSRAIGRDAGLFKPAGRDAARWLAWLTEAQMLLHAHPVNQAREARGLPTINTLWPWGAGVLQDRVVMMPDCEAVFSAHPLVRGLAQAAGLPTFEPPETAGEWVEWLISRPIRNTLVVLDEILPVWQAGDHEEWLAAIEGLEARWFAPLQAFPGKLNVLKIDTGQQGIWRTRPSHRWRIWRGTPEMQSLCAPIV